MDFKAKWNRCLDKIRANIGENRFNVWFSKVEAREFNDSKLWLQVPSRFFMEKFEDDFYNILQSAIRHEFGPDIKLGYEYCVVNNDNSTKVQIQTPEHSHVLKSKLERSVASSPVENRSAAFDSQLNDSLNFENYCVSRSNKLPHTIAEHIANHPEKPDFNPFFLYGHVGVGKTHLIQAIGIRIKERNPRAKVLFV